MNALTKIGESQGELPFSPDFSKRVETLCAHRDKALELYMQAYDIMQLAHDQKRLAAPFNKYGQGLKDVAGKAGDAHEDLWGNKTKAQLDAEKAKARDAYAEEVRKQIDSAVWRQIITETPLEKLMDTKARDDFHHQIETTPPEVTVDNCLATMRQLVLDRELIFRRGLVEAFRALDYHFKSNDAFRIRSRFVMPYARQYETKYFKEERGLRWNYGGNAQSRLCDIERCFHILDGHSEFGSGEIIHAIDAAAARKEFVAETDYFKCRSFKNGSLHVYFLRRDLVIKANKIIAEHFGANVLADNTHAKDPFKPNGGRQKHAADLGDFQSPPDVAQRVIELAEIAKDHRVLEPSAGLGNIALLAAEITEDVVCVEIDANRAAALIYADKFAQVRHDDFLEDQRWYQEFDRVVMNPPFAKGAAVRHVKHAFDMLKVGGRLVAVMPSTIRTRSDDLHVAFRQLVDKHGGTIEDLPEGSFKSEGTMVDCVVVVINRKSRW